MVTYPRRSPSVDCSLPAAFLVQPAAHQRALQPPTLCYCLPRLLWQDDDIRISGKVKLLYNNGASRMDNSGVYNNNTKI